MNVIREGPSQSRIMSPPVGKVWAVVEQVDKEEDGVLGDPHLIQAVSQSYNCQMGTPLSSHSSTVLLDRILCSFRSL